MKSFPSRWKVGGYPSRSFASSRGSQAKDERHKANIKSELKSLFFISFKFTRLRQMPLIDPERLISGCGLGSFGRRLLQRAGRAPGIGASREQAFAFHHDTMRGDACARADVCPIQ